MPTVPAGNRIAKLRAVRLLSVTRTDQWTQIRFGESDNPLRGGGIGVFADADPLPAPFTPSDVDTDITEIIRPAAIVPEEAARSILVELALRDTNNGGLWSADPARWARYDMPWRSPDDPGGARLIGTIQIAYGTPPGTKSPSTAQRSLLTRRAWDGPW